LHWRLPNPARNLAGAGLAGFGENGRISDLPEPEPKSGTTLLSIIFAVVINAKVLHRAIVTTKQPRPDLNPMDYIHHYFTKHGSTKLKKNK